MKPFSTLRKLCRQNDLSYEYISKKLGKSMCYISARFNGIYPFSIEDAYAICDLLHEPYERVLELFPKDGIDAVPLKKATNKPGQTPSDPVYIDANGLCIYIVPQGAAKS